jgi:competence protein ComEA
MLETVEARVRAAAPATAAPAEEPTASATAAGFGSSAGLKPSAGAETSLRDARSAGVEPWLPQRAWVAERPSAPMSGVAGLATSTTESTGVTRGRHRRPRPPAPRLLTLPASLRDARLRAPRAATIGLILVVVLTAGAFGVRVAWAKAASAPRPVGAPATGSAIVNSGARSRLEPSPTNAGLPATSGGAGLTVHVVGQVFKPGLVRLPAGSRVADAVARAGGARPDADLAAINLARLLADGEQLRVPKPGEVVVGPQPAATGSGSGPPAAGGAPGSGLVRLNAATVSELDALPGVGPVLAQRIIDWRTEHGRFASVDELGEVSGIGEKVLAQLKPKVTL